MTNCHKPQAAVTSLAHRTKKLNSFLSLSISMKKLTNKPKLRSHWPPSTNSRSGPGLHTAELYCEAAPTRRPLIWIEPFLPNRQRFNPHQERRPCSVVTSAHALQLPCYVTGVDTTGSRWAGERSGASVTETPTFEELSIFTSPLTGRWFSVLPPPPRQLSRIQRSRFWLQMSSASCPADRFIHQCICES